MKLGAKAVWLPAQSAKKHLEKMKRDHGQDINVVRAEQVVPGPEAMLRLIKNHKAVLGTAHVSPMEAFVVVEAAQNAGVKNMVRHSV